MPSPQQRGLEVATASRSDRVCQLCVSSQIDILLISALQRGRYLAVLYERQASGNCTGVTIIEA